MEPFIFQGPLHDAVMTHPPVPFSTARCHPDLVLGDPQGEDVAATRAGAFPLLSVVKPHSTENPLGQCHHHLLIGVGNASVVEPSGDVRAHLPPPLDRKASPRGASSPYCVGVNMWFLSIGRPISNSLPPPGRLPFRSWLQVVVTSCFHDRSSYRGLSPHLQRAHAGSTKALAADRKKPRPLKSNVRLNQF